MSDDIEKVEYYEFDPPLIIDGRHYLGIRRPMRPWTRSDMWDFVDSFARPNVLAEVLNDMDEPFTRRWEWVKTARPEWLDLLIECINDPPVDDDPEFGNGDWSFAIEEIIGDWGRQDPDFILPRVGEMLDRQEHREVALGSLGCMQIPAAFPYAAPWAERAGELSEAAVVWLVDVLGHSEAPERLSLLKVISERIPPTMEEAITDLARYGVTR